MAKRVEEAVLGFHDSFSGLLRLMDVDHRLVNLMAYNRLAVQLKLLSFEQYENLASELGRLLGDWRLG